MATYTIVNCSFSLFKPEVCSENIVQNYMENNILAAESAGVLLVLFFFSVKA